MLRVLRPVSRCNRGDAFLYAQIRYILGGPGRGDAAPLLARPDGPATSQADGRRAAAALAGAALALTLPVVKGFWPVTIYHQFRSGAQLTERPEQVQKLELIPLGDTWPSLVSIHELWRTRVKDRDDLFALNRRNDQATGNESFLLLVSERSSRRLAGCVRPQGSRTATTYSVRSSIACCAGSPPLCPARGRLSAPHNAAGAERPGSRYLDQLHGNQLPV